MWPYMLIGLLVACGTRIILYDESPFYPNDETYLKMIRRSTLIMFIGI